MSTGVTSNITTSLIAGCLSCPWMGSGPDAWLRARSHARETEHITTVDHTTRTVYSPREKQ